MSAPQQVLFDIPGPKAILRDKIYTVVFGAVLVGLLAAGVWSAWRRGIFDERWSILADPMIAYPTKNQSTVDLWNSFLVDGLIIGTLRAVAISVPIVVPLAVLLLLARLSPAKPLRWVGYVFTHVFRGIPVLLVMYFGVLQFNLDPLWAVVLGLVVYNTAVVAEILRAGVAALPKGQREAGLSIGLTPVQTLLRIQMPQAVRIMLPALVSQIVVLLKDTALGFIIGYRELLSITKNNFNFFGNSSAIPLILLAAVLYIGINMAVSSLAHWLERRLSTSRTKAGDNGAAGTFGGPVTPQPSAAVGMGHAGAT